MSQPFLIRPARAADQNTIEHMVKEAHLNPRELRWSHFLVAEDTASKQIIGCIQARPHKTMPELASLVVEHTYRQAGVGSQLVNTLLAQHPVDLFLMCESEMATYYERFGFQKAGPGHLPAAYKMFYHLITLFRPGMLCTMLRAKD